MRWQILAKNPDQESAFYSKLFGWSVNSDNPLGYRQIDMEGYDGDTRLTEFPVVKVPA